ncbi:MAG: alpha/beta hydrolase fold domain-containing protein [Phycisphaerales bacterium]|nr:alpha/beta hydrolase fold domain-containing protein [Phycisphaerales bacterium]
MLMSLVLCGCLSVPPLHADAQKMLDSGSFDVDAMLAMDPETLQAQFSGFAPQCGIDVAVVEDLTIDAGTRSIPCRFYNPDPETRLPLLVWMHGGGWVLGSLDSTDPTCRLIAARGGVAVLSIGYRLAPQHPFPAAVEDCEAVARWALRHAEELGVDPRRIAVGGDSAGGNLAAVTAASCGAGGGQSALKAQFLVYPALDALADTRSRRDYATGYFLESRQMDWFYTAYEPDRTRWGDPRLSPLRGEGFAQLPPTVLLVAQADVLRDEAVQYAAELIKAGVPVDLLVAPGMLHGFAGIWTRSDAFRSEFEQAIDLFASVMHGGAADPLSALDINLDGSLEPGEAADALRMMQADLHGGPLSVEDVHLLAATGPAWSRAELQELWEDLDGDQSGSLSRMELGGDLAVLAFELDHDGDGLLNRGEFDRIEQLRGDLFAEIETAGLFATMDLNRDGLISVAEAADDPELHSDADMDENGVVDRDELSEAMGAWSMPLEFEVGGDRAYAYGTIDGSTPGRVTELLIAHPEVRTLVLVDVPGSVDDDSNLRACRMIRSHGLATHVPAHGEIASGGVDMFCSGVRRTAEAGARIGVHSWGGLGEAGDTADRDDEAHDMYLEFFREMDIPESFYWFTVEAAGPADIHWMTQEELSRFGLVQDEAVVESAPLSLDLEVIHDPRLIDAGFTKQAVVPAPNGKPIRIIAMAGVPDIAVARARNLLRFFLTDVPGSRYGADKSAVANAMANNGAMLMMPTGHHQPGREPDVDAQPLFQDETPIDGSRWYLLNDWDHRDAAFEEIFHLVHDAGIGTWLPGALPEYQRKLDAEARRALRDGRWGLPIDPDVAEWIEELEAEDSLAQEYIASVIDTYYGLWSAFTERPGGMWGIYAAKTREELDRVDPAGKALVEAFLPPMMYGYEALIDPNFEGAFSLRFDPAYPYTHKSRYYVDATLTGTRDSDLRGNDQDNVLRGNAGDNTLFGGGGFDTAVFSGSRQEYEVEIVDGFLSVSDSVSDRDGCDRLSSIEQVQFGDGEVVHVRK